MRPGTSRISGRVSATNGVPLRQAAVRAILAAGGMKTAVTDDNGRFEFTDLPAGRFTITASKPNFISLTYGQTRPSSAPSTIQLADNQARDNVNLILPRGSVIAGRLVDEYGEPIPDAMVTLLQKRFTQGRMQLMPAGRAVATNDIGEYRLYGLSPGQYFVSTRPRPLAPGLETTNLGYATSYFPGTTRADSAQSVRVALEQTISGVDFVVQATPLASISGIALDAQGAPLRGGAVSAVENGSNLSSIGAPIKPDGTFVIQGVAPGDYIVRSNPVMAVGFSTMAAPAGAGAKVEAAAVQVTKDTVGTNMGDVLMATVSVNGSDVTGVVLTPLRKVTLTGRVTGAGVDAATGANRPQVRLSWVPKSAEAAAMSASAPAAMRSDFQFSLTVPAAEIGLRANVGGQQWVLKAIRVGGVDVTDTGVDLRAAQDVRDVEIEITNRPPEVVVNITPSRTELQGGYTLLVFPEDRNRWLFESRLVSTVAVQNPRNGSGTATTKIRTLPPGRYLAAAFEYLQAGMAMDPDFLESLRGRATSFSVTEGGALVDLTVIAAERN